MKRFLTRAILMFLALTAAAARSSVAAADQAGPLRWWNDAVFYEIFVRSFQDSNGDGSGDLNGIISRLDYLKTLGVDGLWLTPIFKSPSYHGYDATDFKAVNPDYGTINDFDRLVAAAHARGMRIVLDIAVNHTSNQHPWFLNDKSRYVWAPRPLWPPASKWYRVGDEFYYGFFSPKLPDLNWHNPQVMSDVESILDFWAERGADGFRLDAARFYVEGPHGEPDTEATHNVIREFTEHVRSKYPDRFFVGEIWANKPTIASYVNPGNQLDLSFDFPASFALVKSVESQQGQSFERAIVDTATAIRSSSTLAPFLTNHDMVRAATDFSGNIFQLKLAALATMTLPGTPFIYYGEEIGLPDGANQPGDIAKRLPMQWTNGAGHGFTTALLPWCRAYATNFPAINVDSQIRDPASLLTYYRALIRLRHSQAALRRGLLEPLVLQQDSRLAGFVRRAPREIVVVVLNFGATASGAFSFDVNLPAGGKSVTQVLWGPERPQVTVRGRAARVVYPGLAPVSGSVIRIALP